MVFFFFFWKKLLLLFGRSFVDLLLLLWIRSSVVFEASVIACCCKFFFFFSTSHLRFDIVVGPIIYCHRCMHTWRDCILNRASNKNLQKKKKKILNWTNLIDIKWVNYFNSLNVNILCLIRFCVQLWMITFGTKYLFVVQPYRKYGMDKKTEFREGKVWRQISWNIENQLQLHVKEIKTQNQNEPNKVQWQWNWKKKIWSVDWRKM